MTTRIMFLSAAVLLSLSVGGCKKVKIETYNVALAGAFIPYEAERRPAVIDGVANGDADIICLQEVWEQEDKDAIIAAAAANYPYSVSFTHDLDTPLDDATDQAGNIPPPPSTPPCGPAAQQTKLDAVVQCMAQNCSTIPGSADGQAVSIDCAVANCVGAAAPLLFGDAQDQQCFACAVTSLPSETLNDIAGLCTTELNGGLAFRGQSGVVMLSKYPLSNKQDFVIPGTYNRRVTISATVNLPNLSKVDAYCTHLTPIFSNPLFIYTGAYGDGTTGPSAWEAEQQLQADKMLDYIAAQSGDRPAFFLGDLNAGRDFAGPPPIVAEGAATLDLLETELDQAVASDYTPLCTFCTDNPVTDTATSGWIDHIYMSNYHPELVKSTERTFDEFVLSVDDGNGGTMLIPLSDHYGVQSKVVILPGLH